MELLDLSAKFDKVINDGIEKIYNEGMESQENFINTICKDVRNMKDTEIVKRAKGFFVPNNQYMISYFGEEILEPTFDCYNFDGSCNWHNHLVFPIYDIVGNIKGLVGFNPIAKLQSLEGEGTHFYRHSSSSILNKSLNFFSLKGTLRKALEDEYIILIDGVFDALSLVNEGLNAGSLLGSSLSNEHLAYLSFLPRVYLAMDGDSAGLKLASRLQRMHKGVSIIKFNKYKDIDEVLKSKHREEFLKKFEEHRKQPYLTDLILNFK